MTTDGRSLWADQTPAVAVWPELTIAPNGLRIARETLGVSHPVNAYEPIQSDEIKGQWVTVYDAATGDMALEAPASPALDSARRAPTIQEFLRFSQFPLWRVSPSAELENGRLVEVFDMRFGSPQDPGFMASALVDSENRVVKTNFQFGRVPPR